MPKRTVVTLICDVCNQEITHDRGESYYINAEVYGKIFHTKCFMGLSAFKALKALEIDNITLNKITGDFVEDKLIYSNVVSSTTIPR